MYKVERNGDAIIVTGPNDFEQTLPSHAVGIVVRMDIDTPHRYTVQVRDMTDAEIVGCALGISTYPQ